MMKFLRKHQKKLLGVITVVIIASFSFFGTFNGAGVPQIPDQEVGKALDGSVIYERELNGMIRLLSIGKHETLKNDFFSTRLMAILAEKHFAEIQQEFHERLGKVYRFTPFAHPQIPFLSAENIWGRFVPQLLGHLNELKKSEATPKTFVLYCDLYQDQLHFSPQMLSRVLHYQHQQIFGSSPDRSLYDPHHLSLFGYQTFEEWFGPKFTGLLGKFFWNGACIAEGKGYRVSLSEARSDLLRTCLEAVQEYSTEATYADASAFLKMQIQMLGLSETEAAKIWKRVMLVQRLFREVGQGVLIDSLSYQEFSSFAEETATVETYQLPKVLRFSDAKTFAKFQFYLDAVCPKVKHKAGFLPRSFASVEEVEKRCQNLSSLATL